MNVISLNCEKKPIQVNKTKLSLKKKLFEGIIEERDEKKNYPEDSIREEKIKVKKCQLYKKINNLSPDNNKICLNGIKKNKSQSINNLKNWEIDNLVFFNNDKKVLKHPKDKTSIRNIIII